MANLHNQDYQIKIKQGLAANINATATKNAAVEGEPHWTTDTDKLYIFDGASNKRVHGLDMIVVCDGQVVTYNGEVVWKE